MGLLFCSAKTSCAERAVVQAMKAFDHLWLQKWEVTDGEQILRDEPDRLVGGHPVQAIEAGELDGVGKCAQRPFTAQVEIHLKVTECQFAQRAINRFPIAASSVVRFCHR